MIKDPLVWNLEAGRWRAFLENTPFSVRVMLRKIVESLKKPMMFPEVGPIESSYSWRVSFENGPYFLDIVITSEGVREWDMFKEWEVLGSGEDLSSLEEALRGGLSEYLYYKLEIG